MTFAESYTAVKTKVLGELVKHGFVAGEQFDIDLTYHCGRKDFETAVGIKTASVALECHGETLVLVGLYESQGRNILSTSSWYCVPTDGTDEDYAKGVATFCKRVELEINDSYARRLHLPR